jgi:hypothetical protein
MKLLKFNLYAAWSAVFFLALSAEAQINASFKVPILGYVVDKENPGIRPITGIAGSSRIDAPLPLPFAITQVAVLSDQRHAIVASADSAEVLILNLETLQFVPVPGASSLVTTIRSSADGFAAALYYASTRNIVVVTGAPNSPMVHATIDVSFSPDPLGRFAVSGDGSLALMAFSSAEQDHLYGWSSSGGMRHITIASRISDIRFMGEDAVVADSGLDQALLIRNVGNQAVPMLLAEARDGVSIPVAISTFNGNEIYIGNGGTGTVLVVSPSGHILREVSCRCTLTTMEPLGRTGLRLTDQLRRPIIMLDRGSTEEQILFVPGLSLEQTKSLAQ